MFHRILSGGGAQDMTIIPERDVYRLVMRSKLPAAERFEEISEDTLSRSRDVAAFFGKNHRDVLGTIRELPCSDDFQKRNFAPF